MKDSEKMNVKKGLKKEYEKYVEVNQDFYGNAVILAGAAVGRALTEGKTCENIYNEAKTIDLSGFQFGCLISAINHFHPKGQSFKAFCKKEGW